MSFVCKLFPSEKAGVVGHVKRTLVLLAVLSLAFLLKTYHDWGLWSANTYREYDECTEKYVNFEPCQQCSVYHDTALHERCHINQALAAEQKAIYRRFMKEKNFFISSKCSYVTPQLLSYIHEESHLKDGETADYRVPNIVHYVSFNRYEWQFLNYVSVLSTHRFIKPRAIFIHGDYLPHGQWWNRTLEDIPNIYHVYRERPRRIQGKLVQWLEHSSDITRILTVFANGGIYLDTDVIVLKSFDPLRSYPSTLGRETSYGLGSGVIIGEPLSKFMCIWLHAYRNYNPWPWHWAAYAVWAPHNLAKQFKDDIHVELNTLHTPNWQNTDQIYEKTIDWSELYVLHVWHRYGYVPTHPEGPRGIDGLNNTLGEIMRFVYYGDKHVR